MTEAEKDKVLESNSRRVYISQISEKLQEVEVLISQFRDKYCNSDIENKIDENHRRLWDKLHYNISYSLSDLNLRDRNKLSKHIGTE